MSLKLFVFSAVLAVVSAGYLQPTIRYEHAAPIAIPQPPVTYTVPPKSYVEPLSPFITSEYGFKTEHTPVPAPIIRAEHVHAPAVFAAPAVHAAPIAPLATPAVGYAGHFEGSSLGFGRGNAAGFGLAVPASFAHGAVGFAGHGGYATTGYGFGGPAIHSGLGYAGTSFGLARGYAGGFGLGAPHVAPLAFGKGYATGFGFGHGAYGAHY